MSRGLLLLAFVAGCDWDQRALLDSVPLAMDPVAHPSLHVFLGVDGVSREALDEARAREAFADFSTATMVPMFPATSDASWSRLLHAPRVAGYEYTFFDPEKDQLVHEGLGGLVGHVLPPATFDADFPYYRAFEFHGAGYVDAVEDYAEPIASFDRALEDLFSLLGGRVGRAEVVTAYVVEPDVAAHGMGREVMVEMLVVLSARIAQFEALYPRVQVSFTVVSDHGNDHTAKRVEVGAVELARRVGVTPVKSMAEGAAVEGPWAVAVEHTRTTYGVMHTPADRAEAVAALVSGDDAVDVVVSRAQAPQGAPDATGWTALFRGGERLARFGYDEPSATYWLERAGGWASLGLALEEGAQPWVPVTDGAQFEATVGGRYPDLLFRARTALEPLSVRAPATVLYSLREDAVMKGIVMPGTDSMGASGSHGSLGGGGSRGVLLSQARDLPANVRSDDVLALFPGVAALIAQRFGR